MTTPIPRPTLIDRVHDLDRLLGESLAVAQIVHSEMRARWRAASAAEYGDQAAAEWAGMAFYAQLISELRTIRGRL